MLSVPVGATLDANIQIAMKNTVGNFFFLMKVFAISNEMVPFFKKYKMCNKTVASFRNSEEQSSSLQ